MARRSEGARRNNGQRVIAEVEKLEPAPNRPERGLLKLRCRPFNQHGKVVQEMVAPLRIARRA